MDPGAPKLPKRKRWQVGGSMTHPSLVASRALLRASSALSGHNGREGKFILDFTFGWRHKLSLVEQWYQIQVRRARESRSTTRFSTIQHCRTPTPPFFHEYLLIPLADGSHYRVERMGVGPRVDAIGDGCDACDMVEWIPRSQPLDKGILATEVTFPREWDILDVLAICYPISQHPRAKRYRLQTYNCYFQCYAILAILARRSIDIESLGFPAQREKLLERVYDRLSDTCSNPGSEDATKYNLLRLVSVLDSVGGASWGSTIVSKLRGSNTPSALSSSLANAFWLHDLDKQIRQGIQPRLGREGVVLDSLLKQSVPRKTEDREMRDQADRHIQKFFSRRAQLVSKLQEAYVIRDSKAPLSARLKAKMYGPPAGFITSFLMSHSDSANGIGGRTKMMSHLSSARMGWAIGKTIMMDDWLSDDRSGLGNLMDEALQQAEDNLIDDLFSSESGGPSKPLIQLLVHHALGSLSYQNLSATMLSNSVANLVTARALDYGDVATLTTAEKESGLDILAFQDLIRQYIQTYAARVEKHRLDSSILVCRDVEDAIAYAWKTAPDGFGAAKPV